MRFRNTIKWVCGGAGVAVMVGSMAPALFADESNGWPFFGQNVNNTSSASDVSISNKNVGQLKPKWVATTGGDVSARAVVVDDAVYFPDWGGNLWALHADTGKTIWQHQLSDYGLTGSPSGAYHSRTAPALDGGVLYVGTQEGAWLLAIRASSGQLLWKSQLESADPFAIITESPVVYAGTVYTGVASTAESATMYGASIGPDTGQVAPRGSAVAVKAATGEIRWKTYMVPPGYYGGGVWGSNPVVDPGSGTVYVSTGNNYVVPTDPVYVACMANGGTRTSCNSPDDHVDSIVALNMATGQIKWATKLVNWNQQSLGIPNGSDNWNLDCFWPNFGGPVGPQCPADAGPDYDFSSAPSLITYQGGHGQKTILGAGQKSGIYYALDPATGTVLWQTQVGPGSILGGMEWGSASDGKRIYVQITNLYGIPYDGGNAGSWSALDPETGGVLWRTADPSGAITLGPMAVANGVVYAPSMADDPAAPSMLALDAETGQLLWTFASGASVIAGATVVDDSVYWGSGYAHIGFPGMTGNNKFYAFSRNGK